MWTAVWQRWALLLGMLVCGLGAQAAVLDVTAKPTPHTTVAMQWCATPTQTPLTEVMGNTNTCQLQAAKPGDLARGFDNRAFWLRLELFNPGQQPHERWLQVGHPRLEEVSFFMANATGQWQRTEVGINTPLATRDEVSATHKVLAITLAGQQQRTVWVRVASRTSIDLSTTVWTPAELRRTAGHVQLSVTLALGGLLIAMSLALMLALVTRERTYVFFAMAMAGEIVLEAFRGGLLQQHLWPQTWPMWPHVGAIGTTLGLAGFSLVILALVPEMARRKISFKAWQGLVGVTLLGLAWALLLDYRSATAAWTITLNLAIASGLLLMWFAWREGSRAAGTLLLSFVFLALLELLRLGTSLGLLAFSWVETLAGPWALVMTTPIILLSIFQRSRELKDKLIFTQAENTARIEFLAKMSHELRTPLDTILGNAQLLEHSRTTQMRGDELNSIQQSGKHLLHMIDEILDHARGVAGKLPIDPTPVDLAAFLRVQAQNARVLAANNANTFAMHLHGTTNQTVMVDDVRLRQVLDNLLSNAARHTTQGRIMLMCLVDRASNQRITLNFSVQDNGEGIALADQQRVFLPFERGNHNPSHSGKGVGMGLAISRQLVEAMGGSLTLQSTPGQGARFDFSLNVPVCAPQVHISHEAPSQTSVPTHQKCCLLVVDDEANSRRVLNRLFTEHGCDVLEARCGSEAQTLLNTTTQVDLVLTDQFMPNGDGWMVLRMVAACRPEVPVVLMSAAPPQRPDHFPQGLQFVVSLLKPLDHAQLLRCVGDQLGVVLEAPAIAEHPDQPHHQAPTQAPPTAALQPLCKWVEQGQVSAIMEWAEALASDPAHAEFAQTVEQAAQALDFATLRTLCGLEQANNGR